MTPTFESLGFAKFLFSTIGTAILLLWVGWRSGSLHLLRARVWRFFVGNLKSNAPTLEAFYEEYTECVRFRWITGIGVRTAKQAKALAQWCVAHDEGIDAVRRCGQYFDRELPGLNLRDEADRRRWWVLRQPVRRWRRVIFVSRRRGKQLTLPGLWGKLALLLFTLAMGAATVVASGGMTLSGAMVTVKHGSGTWLLLEPQHASLLFVPSIGFTPQDCVTSQKNVVAATKLQPREVGLVCGWFDAPTRNSDIARIVRSQRVAFGVLDVFALFLFLASLRWLLEIDAAASMCCRLHAKGLVGANR